MLCTPIVCLAHSQGLQLAPSVTEWRRPLGCGEPPTGKVRWVGSQPSSLLHVEHLSASCLVSHNKIVFAETKNLKISGQKDNAF